MGLENLDPARPRQGKRKQEAELILVNSAVGPQLDVKSEEVIKQSKDWCCGGVRSEINQRDKLSESSLSGCW